MSKVHKSKLVVKKSLKNQLILRKHAERYILITLLSFALTVGLTRLILHVTDYPQLTIGTLHIAHVLWGGLFLFAAILLLQTFINQNIFIISAILSGVGVGLFIDEVGKFITTTNDYFFPAAAPIIYSFFLLTLLIYTLVAHRSHRDTRMELYQLLGNLEEILDNDFSNNEVEQLLLQIQKVKQNPDYDDLKPIADGLENYLDRTQDKRNYLKPGFLERLFTRITLYLDSHVTKSRLKSILIGGLLGLSIWELHYPATFILHIYSPDYLLAQFFQLVNSDLITGPITIGLFTIRFCFELILGITLAISVILFILNQEKKASGTAYISLLILLTTVNLILFYFDQFSMILNATVQIILLVAIIQYRRKYLQINL